MTDVRIAAAPAVRATTVRSDLSIGWFGHSGGRPAAAVARAMSPADRRHHLTRELERVLYRNFHCAGLAAPHRLLPAPSTPAERAAFVAQLTAANRVGIRWSGPRPVVGVDQGRILVRAGGVPVAVAPADVRTVRRRRGHAGGHLVACRLPRESVGATPGYLTVASGGSTSDAVMTRVYWNILSSGAAPLVERLTAALGAGATRFRLKVLADPAEYARCDAAVLYLDIGTLQRVWDVIAAAWRDLAPWLQPRTPPLALAVAPGVAVAQSPPSGESFGRHRSRLMAEGLLDAWEAGLRSVEDRLDAIENRFLRAGVDPSRPYRDASAPRNPSPLDDLPTRTPATPPTRSTDTAAADDSPTFLEAAEAIGRRLADEAIWSGDLCTWLGADRDALREGRAGMRLLDGDLYDGTAGIGLFLAHAAAATSDAGLARAARGALAHALGRAEAGALGHVGLWTGSPGVVLCALSAATALHDDALTDRGAALLSRHSLPIPESASLDLLSGSAGCAIALLIAAGPLDAPGLHDRALLHGERLLATARRCAGAWSWSPDRTPGRPEPRSTGLAHGAAGIAHALIELHAASGDDRFLEAACGARVHESEHLRAAFAARADHRRGGLAQDPHAPTPPRRAPAPVVGWCNGVSGMALQRARAHLVLGGQTWLNDAQIAHETVASALVRHRAGSELRDTSLCHGAAGVIATVLETSSIVGDSAAGDIASQALTEAVVRYGRAARRWPGGLRGGWTPGLMLGDAGVGHLLLRSAGLAVPDVLLPSAASWFGSDDM